MKKILIALFAVLVFASTAHAQSFPNTTVLNTTGQIQVYDPAYTAVNNSKTKSFHPPSVLRSALDPANGLEDPGADAILFWDDSATSWKPLTLGANCSITGTVLNCAPSLSTPTGYTGQQYFAEQTLTDGATINWNLNTQQSATVTLAGNRTLAAPTNMVNGSTYNLTIIQDATGSRTLTFNSVFKSQGGTGFTLSTLPNAKDLLSCKSDGTNMLCNLGKDYK